MKIGIYLPDVSPDAGGASSLLRTIQKEIQDFLFHVYSFKSFTPSL